MNKRQRDLLAEIESYGFGYDHTNAKGISFYVHEETGAELKVLTSSCDERYCRSILLDARRLIGLPTKDNKRNPAQIRERNAAEHQRAAVELERLRQQREDCAPSASEAQFRAIEDAYLKAERKFRYWQRLMQEVPA